MDYITLDFETANSNYTSACSIGIIGVKDDNIVLKKHYLINPEEPFFSFNTLIHGIKAEDCYDKPTFKELWEEIKIYFNHTTIYCHNSLFDISVLKSLIEKYHLDCPIIQFGCTVKIASKLWKDILPNFKLNTISKHLNLMHQHHNALSDAAVCVYIIQRGIRMNSVIDHVDLYDHLGLSYGVYNNHVFFHTHQKQKTKKTSKKVELVETHN